LAFSFNFPTVKPPSFLRVSRHQILLLNTQSCTLVFIALGPGDLPTATGPLRQDALRSKNVQSFVHALSRLKIAAAFYCSLPLLP